VECTLTDFAISPYCIPISSQIFEILEILWIFCRELASRGVVRRNKDEKDAS